MADAPSFAKLVPGFDFLQNLVKNAGSAMPNIGQWVAPTLDPAEIEKRIEELKTVQFWLEQNARMLGATIQALEVQRMTLSTLQTMNVQMADLRDSLTIRMPDVGGAATRPSPAAPSRQGVTPSPAPASPAPSAPAAPPPPTPVKKRPPAPSRETAASAAPSGGAGPVDPLQWWGALTKQFTELAASAMKDTAGDAAKGLGAMAAKGLGAMAAQGGLASAADAQSPKAEAAARAGRKAKGKPARKPAGKNAQP